MLKRLSFISALLFLISAVPLFGQASSQVILAGYNHRPVIQTPAMGFAKITLEGDTLYVEGEFQDLRGTYWAAYIHYGEPGKRGHRMLRLSPELSEDRQSGVFKREDNKFILTEAVKNALRKGHLYINVSSHRFQHGEIRGQIPMM